MVMKNRPSSTSWNGRMSVSTWCLNSVSEISMPAMKAPSASDSPASSVSQARPRVTSSRFSTNSSSLLRRATRVSHQRITRCPPVSSSAMRTAALKLANASALNRVSGGLLKAGISTSKGTTARSWNSSTPDDALAVLAFQFQPLGQQLDDDGRAAHRHRARQRNRGAPLHAPQGGRQRRQEQRADGGQHDREQHLGQPEPEDVRSHGPQLVQVEFQADHEHQEHHAELGQVAHGHRVLGQCQRIRSDQHAHHQVTQHRRAA